MGLDETQLVTIAGLPKDIRAARFLFVGRLRNGPTSSHLRLTDCDVIAVHVMDSDGCGTATEEI